MARLWVAVLATAVCGCGGDAPQGVQVTEAPTESERVPSLRRPVPLDTVYADSGLFSVSRLRLDSLRADSLRRDSVARDSVRQETVARPDFRTAWPAFLAAVRQGRAAVRPLAAFSDAFREDDFPTLYEAALADGPFRAGVLALTPRDFRRDGTTRQATVTVGYDASGSVVPEDEAVTEASVVLRFDVVDGAYRLVRIALAG